MKFSSPGIVVAKLIAAGMLFGALGHHPYSYYSLLRLVVCGVSVFAAIRASDSSKSGWTWPLAITAIVFNPIIPFHLTREIWAFIDIGAAVLLLISVIVVDRKLPPK